MGHVETDLRIQLESESEYSRLLDEAESIVMERMKNLDGDDIAGGFKSLTFEDYQSLKEDFGRGDMRDTHHGGSVVAEAIERYVREQVIRELQGY